MSKLVLILVVQLCYVPMLSLRTISMVKNLKVLTAFFGFLEAVIYIFGLAIVLSGEQSIIEMLVYAIGFSIGLVAGILIEQKLAIGFTSVHVNINHETPDLIEELRDKGFGVTAYVGEGRNGTRNKLEILTSRKREEELIAMVLKQEPNAFILSFEPKMFKGGYLGALMKKRMLLRKRSVHKSVEEPSVIEKTIEEIKMEVTSLKDSWQE